MFFQPGNPWTALQSACKFLHSCFSSVYQGIRLPDGYWIPLPYLMTCVISTDGFISKAKSSQLAVLPQIDYLEEEFLFVSLSCRHARSDAILRSLSFN